MENKVELQDWSKIPTDLLEECCKRLDMSNLLRLGAVCKMWHSSTSNKAHLSSPEIPWLIYDSEESSKFHIFTYSAPHNHYEIYKPFRPFRGSSITASTKGWLFIRSHPKLFILNIFSRIRIDLPPQTTFPGLLKSPRGGSSISNDAGGDEHDNDDGMGMNTPMVFVISTCRNLNPISVAAVTKGGDLAWCNLRDDAWKGHRGVVEYSNITFHDGKLFAVSRDGSKIDMFRVDNSIDKLILMGSINDPNLSTPNIPNGQLDVYLLESKGSLLIMKRFYNNVELRQTNDFHVFKVEKDHDNSTRHLVVALNGLGSLGGQSLFVSNGLNCESIDPIDCPEFMNDHIYFIGQSDNATTYEYRVFSMANSHMDRVSLPDTDRYKCPIWVMPRVAFECDCPNHDLTLWKPKRSSRKRKFHLQKVNLGNG